MCHSLKLPGFDYCASHKCGVSDCGELRTGAKHCMMHSCRITDCIYPTSSGALLLCKEHTCHYPDCGAAATALGGYCKSHLCRYNGCGAGRLPGNYGFCENHRCAAEGCTEGVYYDSPYCIDHQPQ